MKILILDDMPVRHTLVRNFCSEHFKNRELEYFDAYSVLQAKDFSLKYNIDHMFLDHDLGGPHFAESGPGTGYEFAKWLEECPQYAPSGSFFIITLNPTGRASMIRALKSIGKPIQVCAFT